MHDPYARWQPCAVAVNPSTNKVYVANCGNNTVTVINGANDTLLVNVPLGDLGELVAVYRQHGPGYRGLVTRIEATDCLIDQIVYKLYGLTEDEIAIVESG